MTNDVCTMPPASLRALSNRDKDWLLSLLRQPLREVIEEEVLTEAITELQASKARHTTSPGGHRSKHEMHRSGVQVLSQEAHILSVDGLRLPEKVSQRYLHLEKALVEALLETCFRGRSAHSLHRMTEELYRRSVSPSAITNLLQQLDRSLQAFAARPLLVPYCYLVLDARPVKVREDKLIQSQKVLAAVGVDADGRRQVLGVELADRVSRSIWREFLLGLRRRGLSGVEYVVCDVHAGLEGALHEMLPEAVWQRCQQQFLLAAIDHLPTRRKDSCLRDLRQLYDCPDEVTAHRELADWRDRWQPRYPELADWVDYNIENTFKFYRLPPLHRKHMRSTNIMRQFRNEVWERTQLVRTVPDLERCLRLILSLAMKTDKHWEDPSCHLEMDCERGERVKPFRPRIPLVVSSDRFSFDKL